MEILIGLIAGFAFCLFLSFRFSDGNCRAWIGGQIHPENIREEMATIAKLKQFFIENQDRVIKQLAFLEFQADHMNVVNQLQRMYINELEHERKRS